MKNGEGLGCNFIKGDENILLMLSFLSLSLSLCFLSLSLFHHKLERNETERVIREKSIHFASFFFFFLLRNCVCFEKELLLAQKIREWKMSRGEIATKPCRVSSSRYCCFCYIAIMHSSVVRVEERKFSCIIQQ